MSGPLPALSISHSQSARQGLVMNLAKSPGLSWGVGSLSQHPGHSPGRAVSSVAGNWLQSRACLPRTVSGVDFCAVQETPQAGLLNTPVTTGGRAGCQSVHRPPVICHRRRIRGEKEIASMPMLFLQSSLGWGGYVGKRCCYEWNSVSIPNLSKQGFGWLIHKVSTIALTSSHYYEDWV